MLNPSMRFVVKNRKQLQPIVHLLRELTNPGPESAMRWWLQWPDRLVAVVCYDKGKPVGWAAALHFRQDVGRTHLGVFVARSHRKHGIGTKLAQRLIENCADLKRTYQFARRAERLFYPALEAKGYRVGYIGG